MYTTLKNIYKVRKGSAGSETTGTLTKLILIIAFVGIGGLIVIELLTGGITPYMSLYSDYTGGLS